MIFLADENFQIQAVRLLNAFDTRNDVRHLTEEFGRGTPDAEWIAACAHRFDKPVIIGGDGRILRNKVERAALRESDLSYVYLAPGWTNISWNDFAWKIVKAWPGIVGSLKDLLRPAVYEVKVASLKVERISETAAL